MTAHTTEVIPGGGPVSAVPAELRALPNWVGWRYLVTARGSGPEDRPPARTKFPLSPVTKRGADCTDPATWGTFEQALALCDTDNCDGVSFALAPPFVGIDLDRVIDPDTGAYDPGAAATVERFASYTELSPSRAGVHILVRGTLAHLTGRKRGGRECYDGKRFLTVTGLRGAPHGIESRQEVLDAWHAETFPRVSAPVTHGPSHAPELTDWEILDRIGRSKQGPKFARLWAGNRDGYASGSEADLALCGILAFWCRRDPVVVDRLFRASGLMRPKWTGRRGDVTYGARTIAYAIETSSSYDPEYYTGPPASCVAGAPALDTAGEAPAPPEGRAAGAGEAPIPHAGAPPPARGARGAPPPLPLLYFADMGPALDASDFVEGLLLDGAMSVVYGESNCGKTFFVLDLALHVAAGEPWRGRAVERRGVLYLALEGSYGIRNRVAAFKTRAPPPPAELPFAVVPVGLNLLAPDGDTVRVVEAARAAADRLRVPVGLVVVDTLSRAMAGGNENAPEDMTALIARLDVIRQALPAHVTVVHHSGKDAAKGARGHSSLRAATDTEIELTRDPVSGTSAARVTKQRDLEGGAEFAFRLVPVELGADRRGKPVTSCVVREVEAPTAPAGASGGYHALRTQRAQLDERAVLTAIDAERAAGHGGATVRRVRALTGFSHDRACAALARLVEAGAVVAATFPGDGGNGHARAVPGWRRAE